MYVFEIALYMKHVVHLQVDLSLQFYPFSFQIYDGDNLHLPNTFYVHGRKRTIELQARHAHFMVKMTRNCSNLCEDVHFVQCRLAFLFVSQFVTFCPFD